MTKFKVGTKLKQVSVDPIDSIVDQLHEQGKVVPIIGNQITNDLLFGSEKDLVESWADYIEYPLPDKHRFTVITQFTSVMLKADQGADDAYIKKSYLDWLTQVSLSLADEGLAEEVQADTDFESFSFSEVVERLELLDFSNPQENIFLLLADLPIPIYMTTSFHTLLESALRNAGKEPRMEICYWDPHLRGIQSVFEAEPSYHPTPQEPLVYHLHGLDEHPSSLVITEDDHLDFLINISEDWEGIPFSVRQALSDSSLMILGYSLRSWDFRVIFRGLIRNSNDTRRPKSVTIQVPRDEVQEKYLKNYLDVEGKFDVFSGDSLKYVKEIWEKWSGG